MIATLLAVLLGAIPDCSPAASGAPPSPEEAAAYLAAAEEELRAGQTDAARAALRRAVELDPTNDAAAARLRSLCRSSAGEDFDQAMALMDRGDCVQAAARFARLAQTTPDPSLALLEGICRYELEEDDRARALLTTAAGDDRFRDSAQLFLGLIALRANRPDAAQEHFAFASASTDSRLRDAAVDLRRLGVRDRRLVVSLSAEGIYDTNANLAADAEPGVERTPDASALLGLSARFQPFSAAGPYLRAGGAYRKQRALTSLDFAMGSAFVGYRQGEGRSWLAAEAGVETMALGAEPYLNAAAANAAVRLALGPAFVTLSYAGRSSAFAAQWSAYSGALHRGAADLGVELSNALVLSGGFTVQRDATADPALAYLELGPRVQASLRAGPNLRLTAVGAVRSRRHDAVDPSFQLRRADSNWAVDVSVEYDLSDSAALYLIGSTRHSSSNVVSFDYAQYSGSAGLVVYWSAL